MINRLFTTATLGAAALIFVAALASAPQVAPADEYFIPKGHLYTPESSVLPPPGSRQAQIEREADILQTELIRKERERRVFFERFQHFIDRDLFYPSRSYSVY